MLEKNKLIEVLHMLKAQGNDLGTDTLKAVAKDMGLPISVVSGVASFYSDFNGMSDGSVELSFAEGGLEGEMFVDDNYALLDLSAEEIMKRIEASGIGGFGGSGYPMARKWAFTAQQKSDTKYVVCNCSEGEGETYKDMKLLIKAPWAVIEGVLLCAKAVGAGNAIIYVRAEYGEAKSALEKQLEKGVPGDVNVEVFGGAGAYVCGEETALLRSLEGLRGEPALKPPYPGEKGLWGYPTVINNAESFAAAAAYIRSGKRNKLYTVSGCVKKPGVYEMPYGSTVSELADAAELAPDVCGFRLGGGASGLMLGMDKLGMPLSFEDCAAAGAALGTGSVRFFASEAELWQAAAESAEFLASQSCGKCAPCRYGTAELSRLAKKLEQGDATEEEIAAAKKLCDYLKQNSRCGLGQSAGNCMGSALTNFPLGKAT